MTGRRNIGSLVLLLLVAIAMTGCTVDMREENGPLGPAEVHVGPPWRVAPGARAKRSTTTTGPTPCEPSKTGASDECEGGACRTLPVPTPTR